MSSAPAEEEEAASATASPDVNPSQDSRKSERRPTLPPRPSELGLLSSKQEPTHGLQPRSRGGLISRSTTAVSVTDVNTYTRGDGIRETHSSTQRRMPSSPSLQRYGSRQASDAGDETSSLRSYMPNTATVDDMGSFFGDDQQPTPTRPAYSSDKDGKIQLLEMEADFDFGDEFSDVVDNAQDERVMVSWKAKKKHFIILSAAGKPIYSRHGSDGVISSYVGIIQTIISFYQSASDPLRSFTADGVKFVVLCQTNLFLVAISSLLESESQLRMQLEALYMQILSTLTLPTLTHLFANRPSTDLRRPLQGTEVLLSTLADSFTRGSPSTLLSALECLKIRKSHRQVINNTLLKARVDDLLYGLIVAGGRLVSVVRPKKHSLHPGDLQLLFNMLFEADGIKAGGGESWIPICLPGFNNKGYLYMYVSFLDTSGNNVHEIHANDEVAKDDTVAIILLSASKDSFENLRSMKQYLIHELNRNRSMQVIQQAVQSGRLTPTEIVPGTVLRHFLYKSKGNVQFFMPSFSRQYENIRQRRQLMSLYHVLHASVHIKHAAVKVQHSLSTSFTALAWVTPMFELYCVAGPQSSRNALAQSANKIVQWVQREEERIFIIGGAVF